MVSLHADGSPSSCRGPCGESPLLRGPGPEAVVQSSWHGPIFHVKMQAGSGRVFGQVSSGLRGPTKWGPWSLSSLVHLNNQPGTWLHPWGPPLTSHSSAPTDSTLLTLPPFSLLQLHSSPGVLTLPCQLGLCALWPTLRPPTPQPRQPK